MSHPSKLARAACLVAMMLAAGSTYGQRSIGDALAIARGALGPGPNPPLLGAAIDDSVDGETWNLIFVGGGMHGERRIVSIVDGKLQPEAPRSVWPFSTGNFEVLRSAEIDLTIPGLRRLAAERATRMAIKPACLKYVLNRKAGESFAVWDVYLIDRKRIVIGHIRIEAASGTILKEEFSSGNTSGTKQPGTPPQVASPHADPSSPRGANGRTTLHLTR